MQHLNVLGQAFNPVLRLPDLIIWDIPRFDLDDVKSHVYRAEVVPRTLFTQQSDSLCTFPQIA